MLYDAAMASITAMILMRTHVCLLPPRARYSSYSPPLDDSFRRRCFHHDATLILWLCHFRLAFHRFSAMLPILRVYYFCAKSIRFSVATRHV